MELKWIDIKELGVSGKGWIDTKSYYDRLPARAEGIVTDAVWSLSRQSTGMWVDFVSDVGTIHARTKLRNNPPPEHHYIKYLDLYCRDDDGNWRWAGVSKYGFMPSGETPLIEGLSQKLREWRMYLPLTYEVDSIELGISENSFIRMATPDYRKPVVIYGTSIVHGCGHLSRPGMVWPSIVGRHLDYPVINLGFSGSARMEPNLADIIAEIDPAVFVIDPLANMGKDLVEQNAEPFLRILLKAHPTTPILLIEDRTHSNAWLNPDYLPAQLDKQAAFRDIADKLLAEGYQIEYIYGADLIGTDSEATTDGSHPSDLGAMRYADVVSPVLQEILNIGKKDE
ncbi:MAG: SGNH/GDSL hydrolase family protein [bacterium]